MKFLSHDDGNVEDNGAVFKPFEEAYWDASNRLEKCNALLRLHNANKGRLRDKHYWGCGNSQWQVEQQHASCMVACASSRLALQEALKLLVRDGGRLTLYLDALMRYLSGDCEKNRLYYLGLNNCILGRKLLDEINRLQPRMQTAVLSDPTEGLGNQKLKQAFAHYAAWLDEWVGHDIPVFPDTAFLSYVAEMDGMWLMTAPETVALTAHIAACRELVRQARETNGQLIAACKLCNETQFQAHEPDSEAKRLQRECAQQLKRCEAASLRLAVRPLIDALRQQVMELRTAWKAVRQRFPEHLLRIGASAPGDLALINNCLFAASVDREITVLLARELPVTDSLTEFEALEAVFRGEMPLTTLRCDN